MILILLGFQSQKVWQMLRQTKDIRSFIIQGNLQHSSTLLIKLLIFWWIILKDSSCVGSHDRFEEKHLGDPWSTLSRPKKDFPVKERDSWTLADLIFEDIGNMRSGGFKGVWEIFQKHWSQAYSSTNSQRNQGKGEWHILSPRNWRNKFANIQFPLREFKWSPICVNEDRGVESEKHI